MLLVGSQAQAGFYTYFEWVGMSDERRASYIAGVLDSYLAFAGSYRSTADHYQDCVFRLSLTDRQLSDGVRTFAASRPAEQAKAVPGILIRALIYLTQCPASPSLGL
jgi:hypothetical protein